MLADLDVNRYNCNSYFNGQPQENHWNCTYSFEPFDKILTLDKVWKCDDKDAAHPQVLLLVPGFI
jgi:hypothetical protein